jgi:serine protease Do
LAAFKNVVARPSESTVRVLCDDKEAALGTIVSADGWIVTKASLLRGKVTCKVKGGKALTAKIVGVEEDNDLAMLKVEASGLKPIEWRAAKSADVGDFLAAPGVTDTPVAVGVISVGVRKMNARGDVPRRAPSPNSGYLGVRLGEIEHGVKVDSVEPGKPAAKAGLKAGDIVLSVGGRKVTSVDGMVAAIQGFKAGQVVQLRIKRGDDEVDLKATLERRPSALGRGEMMDRMGSKLSERRGGFPEVLQHDLVVKPEDCGGPVVDLEGKAIGINIARAGRTESFAIPYEVVQGLMSDLKSGKLAPKDDGEDRIAELEAALKKAQMESLKLKADLSGASRSQKKVIEGKLEEVQKKITDTQNKLDRARKDLTKQ